MANDDFKIKSDVEKSDFCPLLLAGWLAHYGAEGKNGKMSELCRCGSKCAWFDDDIVGCAVLGLINGESE